MTAAAADRDYLSLRPRRTQARTRNLNLAVPGAPGPAGRPGRPGPAQLILATWRGVQSISAPGNLMPAWVQPAADSPQPVVTVTTTRTVTILP